MPKDKTPTARQVIRQKERVASAAKAVEAMEKNDDETMGAPGMRAREEMDKASKQGKLTRPAAAKAMREAAAKQLERVKADQAKTAAIEQAAKDLRVDKDLAARMEAAIPTGSIPIQNPGRNPFMTGTRRRKRKGGRKGRKTRRRA